MIEFGNPIAVDHKALAHGGARRELDGGLGNGLVVVDDGHVYLARLEQSDVLIRGAVGDADVDVVVFLTEAANVVDEEELAQCIRRADADLTKGDALHLAELVLGHGNQAIGLLDVLEHHLALAGEFHALACANEQAAAQLRLQLFDGLRNGGLRDKQLLFCLGKAARLGNDVENAV